MRIDLGDRPESFEHRFQDLRPELGVGHLSSTELQCHFDLVTFFQELEHVTHFRVEVAGADLRPELHLFGDDLDGLFARLFETLGFFISELPIVHDSADRRVGLRRDFDEVEIGGSCPGEGIFDRHDANLRTVCVDESHSGNPDALVVARLIG